MLEPYYGENFTFDLFMSIREMQRTILWLAVMEPRCCAPPRSVGEAGIELATIWALPHHRAFHKWAQLDSRNDPSEAVVGFLKVDISIIFRGDSQILPSVDNYEKVEDNLLLPSGSEQQRANFSITIHGAFGLPATTTTGGEKRFGKPPSAYVRISFCGIGARTAVQQRTHCPVYNERISIVEMFPNMCQIIYFEVYSAESCLKVIARTSLNLRLLSHDGEKGFLPTFGPSLLPMYDDLSTQTVATTNDSPFYRGSLLVSLKTTVPYYEKPVKSKIVEPVANLKLENLWPIEEFCVMCPLFEVSLLDRRIVGKYCGVAITVGDFSTSSPGDREFETLWNEIRSRKLHYTGPLDVIKTSPVYGHLDFSNAFPVLQLATRLPDLRSNMYRNNVIKEIIMDLEYSLSQIEKRYKTMKSSNPQEFICELNNALDKLVGGLKHFLETVKESSCEHKTELDQKLLKLQEDAIVNLNFKISKRIYGDSTTGMIRSTEKIYTFGSKKEFKALLAESKSMAESLRSLIPKIPEPWPDIVVWLLNGGSRVAYKKISPADVIHSVVPEEAGQKCGCIHTIYFQPLKCPYHCDSTGTCSCIVGKLEMLMWMGLFKQIKSFDGHLPDGYKMKVKNYDMGIKTTSMMLECRAFIYQAKFDCTDRFEMDYTFARINILNSTQETNVKEKTLSPIWNQVLRIYKMVLMSPQRLMKSPPLLLIEIFDTDLAGNFGLIGRSEITPAVDERQGYEYAPNLEWFKIHNGMECTGQILMSVQLIQVPETVMRTTIYGSTDATYCATGVQDLDQNCEKMEKLPTHLIPESSSYKVDIYWWGLRNVTITKKPCMVFEMETTTIKSDVIVNEKSICNFPNGRISQIFEGIVTKEFCPPLFLKLYETSTFGRTVFLGSNMVQNPMKYFVNWMSHNDRELSLRSASLSSANLYQVNSILSSENQTNYVSSCKKSIYSKTKNITVQTPIKVSKWKRIFCTKEPDEEEYTLLPMFDKYDRDNVNFGKITKRDVCNWWSKFLKSQKDNDLPYTEDSTRFFSEIKVYDAELEKQPEFSKFKDWCSTFKLYNGNKTGIPEKDDQIFCGYLKAGIAIYKWPPPENTKSVSTGGVDLGKGYFSNYPSNEAAKVLVRVYLVSATNLSVKSFIGQTCTYATVNCGKKELGNRHSSIASSTNPIFGTMYELRCVFPEDYLLTVSVYSKDSSSLSDELIGSSSIDLEDRFYSKHRACIGLAAEYNLTGPLRWRDFRKPSAILEELCLKNHIPPPFFLDASTLFINGVEYKDNSGFGSSSGSIADRKENICLSILHKWHTLPIIGHHLVPEHVETRSLFNPEKLGFEQGKIQMWVDIYPMENGVYIPPPVNIEPQKVEDYALKAIIRQVKLFRFKDQKIKVPKNIQIQCWIGNTNRTEKGDIQSSQAEFYLNWQIMFPIHYHPSLAKLVNKERDPFTEFEEYSLPIFEIRILEEDIENENNVIASLSLNLNNMPQGALSAQSLSKASEGSRRVHLFSSRSVRGWWPLTSTDETPENGTNVGIINMELNLSPLETAVVMSVMQEPLSPQQPRHQERNDNSNIISNLEAFFRTGKIEYVVVGVIILFTFILIVFYFDLARNFHIFFFD
ncbi:otoferlin isoform X2 [Bombyx mori]